MTLSPSIKRPVYEDDIGFYHATQILEISEQIKVGYSSEDTVIKEGKEYAKDINTFLEEGEISEIELKLYRRLPDKEWLMHEEFHPEDELRYTINFEIEWDLAGESDEITVLGSLEEDKYNLHNTTEFELTSF